MLLVGDIGGTNIRLGLVDGNQYPLSVKSIVRLKGDDFDTFEEALSEAIKSYDIGFSDLSVIFAVAGPVKNNTVNFINRKWTIDAEYIKNKFEFKSVQLINDFVAMARCVPELTGNSIEEIKRGNPVVDAPIIVAGPGTGFGVATLLKTNNTWGIISGEGGYHSYAPRTPTEMELTTLLSKDFDFVSTELICAGVGLPHIHKNMCKIYDREYEYIEPQVMRKLASVGDEMFLEICKIRARGTLMALGDFTLINGALGGAYIAGGAAVHLSNYFKFPESLERFQSRGLKSNYLSNCPIHLITDPAAALIGAAAYYFDKFHQEEL